jgi:hypothetical protein
VRRAGGVPGGWASRLAAIDGVGTVARVRRAQAMLRSTGTAAGRTRRVRGGYAVALDTFVVPRAYARLLPAPARTVVRRLRAGTAILSRTSARVRGVGAGGTLTLRGGRRLRIVGVLDDGLVRSAELVVSATEGARLGARAPYLLAAVEDERAARRAELLAARGVRCERSHRMGQRLGVAGPHQNRRVRADDLRYAGLLRSHDGEAGGQVLEQLDRREVIGSVVRVGD